MKMKFNWTKFKNKSGVYRITVNSKKSYIGSSTNLYLRCCQHLAHLRKNKHHSRYLQHSYNKYGEKSITFEVLEICPKNIKILREKERYYINKYNPFFNSVDPVEFTFSDEMKKKISETLKRKYKSGEIKCPTLGKGHRLWVYNFKGELLKENITTEEVVKLLKISNRQVVNNAVRKNCPIINLNYIVLKNNDWNVYYKWVKNNPKKKRIRLFKVFKDGSTELCTVMSRKRILDKVIQDKDYMYYSKKLKCFYTFIGLISKCRSSKKFEELLAGKNGEG